MIEALSETLQIVVFSPYIWGVIFLSALYGILMGAIPGLTATMAVALFVPITYWMDPIPALAAIATITACAIFSGDIPSALLRIPGTPASAAYVDDLYAFTRRGETDRSLGTGLTASVFGGLFGTVVLVTLGSQLARVATMFSVAEYFWLYLLGLSSAVIVARDNMLKSLLGLLIGLLFATVGLSAVHTEARFTFGIPQLYQGISFIPAMIGLFGLSEVLRSAVAMGLFAGDATKAATIDGSAGAKAESGIDGVAGSEGTGKAGDSAGHASKESFFRRAIVNPLSAVYKAPLAMMARRKRAFLRSGVLGSLIGMLPGAGVDIASWVSVALSKRSSKKPELYGKGSLEGISDASVSNGSALAGCWIPALVFGIPGDSVTAIVIGVLLMKNLTPGPEIFMQQPVLVYSIYSAFFMANIALFIIGYFAIKAGRFVIGIPQRILLPVILVFCIIGSYAIQGSYFDVIVMLFMGGFGFFLERRAIPLGPVVLGMILGGPLEERFIQTITGADGILLPFFSRPISAGLGILFIGMWVWAIWQNFRRKPEGVSGVGA